MGEQKVREAIKDALRDALGGEVALDETIVGLRSTAFHAMAIAVADTVAREDETIDPGEEAYLGDLLGLLGLMTQSTSAAARAVLNANVLAHLLSAEFLECVSELFDTSAATLLWAAGLEMALADGALGSREEALLDRLAAAIPVDPEAAKLIKRTRLEGRTVGPEQAQVLTVIHPAMTLALGVGASKLAASIIKAVSKETASRIDINESNQGRHDELTRFTQAREKILNVYDELEKCGRFLKPAEAAKLHISREVLDSGRFQLTVIGEFSRGKSTLLNAILGGAILPRAMVPCNSGIVRLKYADEPTFWIGPEGSTHQDRVSYPEFCAGLFSGTVEDTVARTSGTVGTVNSGIAAIPHPLLKDSVEVLDTPGLNENEQLEAIVYREAERSDAFVLVVSAMQPVTKLEVEAIDMIQKQGGKATFVACNHMNLVPPPQRKVVKARVLESLKGHLDAAEDRTFFVGAEPALLTQLGEAPPDEWLQSVIDLRGAITTFLATERATSMLTHHLGVVETNATMARSTVEQLVEKERNRAHQEREETRSKLEGQIRWIRDEINEIDARKGRMRGRVERFVRDLTSEAEQIVEKALGEIAEKLPSASSRWKSDRTVLMPWEVAKDFGSQAESYIGKEINARVERDIGIVADRLTKELAEDIGQDAASLYSVAQGVCVRGLDFESAKEDPEDAGIRFLKSVVGVVLVGPAGFLAGAAPISHIIAMGIAGFITAFVIAFLGGGPITIAIGLAVSTIAVIAIGREGMKNSIRDKLVKKLSDELPGMMSEIRDKLRDDLKGKGEEILEALDAEIERLKGQAEENLKALEKDKATFEKAESSGSKREAQFSDDLKNVTNLVEHLKGLRDELSLPPA